MPWPTMSDYQDAIQNPQLAFMDQELRQGRPVTDSLGLPRPITGGFASVYQIHSAGTKWAVRCFLRCHQDTERRYGSIGNHLVEVGLPYTAAFQYLARGILVKGQWYPVLKMEWVDGEPLNAYVEKNLSRTDVLQDLDREFTKMVRDLRRVSVAHGDLQHGNILVVNGKLRLVDYDGMFVPDLMGLSSHEVGHPNYQHPARSEKDFGPYLDNFSAHIIHASLVSLSIKPSLWRSSGAGDEQLVFSRRDYRDPASSQILRAMEDSRDATLASLASRVRSIAACPAVSSVPALGGSQGIRTLGEITGMFRSRDGGESKVLSRQQVAVSSSANGGGVLPSWLEDHLPAKVLEFESSFVIDRVLIAVYALCALVLARAASAGLLPGVVAAWGCAAGFVAAASLVLRKFARTPEFRAKWSALTGLRKTLGEARVTRSALEALSLEAKRLAREEQRTVCHAAAKIKKIGQGHERDQAKVDAWLQDRLGGLSRTYRGKWALLLLQEESVRSEAGRRRMRISEKYGRRQDEVLSHLQEAQAAISEERALVETKAAEEREYLARQESRAEALRQETRRYGRITLVDYLKRIVCFSQGIGRQGVGSSSRGGP